MEVRNRTVSAHELLAARWLQHASLALDEKAARTGRPLTGRSITERLIGH